MKSGRTNLLGTLVRPGNAVLDVETLDDIASAKLIQGINERVEHVTANLRRPLIYASPSFWQKLPAADIEQKADLWIAEWEIQAPEKMGNWPGWSFWQYTAAESASATASAAATAPATTVTSPMH